MGIIILPFLLGAIIIVIIAIVKSVKLLKLKIIGLKEIILGLFMSSTIFGLIVLSYLIAGSAWVFSTAFRLPIFMVFIPFLIFLTTEKSTNPKTKYISKILLISIGVTGILGLIFNDIFFGLIDYLGIEKNY